MAWGLLRLRILSGSLPDRLQGQEGAAHTVLRVLSVLHAQEERQWLANSGTYIAQEQSIRSVLHALQHDALELECYNPHVALLWQVSHSVTLPSVGAHNAQNFASTWRSSAQTQQICQAWNGQHSLVRAGIPEWQVAWHTLV